MSKKSESIFKIAVFIADICSIVFSYVFAFFIRTDIDSRPYYFNERSIDFISTILLLIPIWIAILISLGLYKKEIIVSKNRSRGNTRLILASGLGIMAIITVSFFKNENIFPVRLVALYTFLLCAFFLILFRTMLYLTRKTFLKKGHHGVVYALIIGNNSNTKNLAEYFYTCPESGYRVVSIVAGAKYIPKNMKKRQYSSLKEAIKKTHPDVIFQTDGKHTEYVYKQSLNYHIPYYFVPSEDVLSSQVGEMELVGNTPTIIVKTTPLDGFGQTIKRCFDIFGSIFALIILAIPILTIWVCIKISSPNNKALYSDYRLTKDNKKFKIYKFRSMKPEFSGMSPEKAFEKMGKPGLSKKYRKNGDFLENDPRMTKIGKFLRKTSLDELPQFWNVLKGDISLVGPRALVPGELRTYGDRSLLLSIKSGLTGLAQVSGRREISFEERRQLDLYYIHNWSLWMDIQILCKTFTAVIKRKGAK